MEVENLRELMIEQLKDIFSAENQLMKSLPKMVKGARSNGLVEAFKKHLKETEGHVERLHSIEGLLKTKLGGKKCKGMQGLISESEEALEVEGSDSIVDLGIIAAAQKVEHYEISAYGTLLAFAEQLGEEEVGRLLQETLEEEEAADEKLSEVSIEDLLPEESDESTADDEEDDEGIRDER